MQTKSIYENQGRGDLRASQELPKPPAFSLTQADEKIAEIRKDLLPVEAHFYWRMNKPDGLEQKVLVMSEQKLPRNLTGVHQEVCSLDISQDTATKMDKVLDVEKDCLVLGKKVVFLEQLRSHSYIKAFAVIERRLGVLLNTVDTRHLLSGRVGLLQTGLDTILKQTIADERFVENGFFDHAFDLCRLYQMTIDHLAAEVQAMPDFQVKANPLPAEGVVADEGLHNANSKDGLSQSLADLTTQVDDLIKEIKNFASKDAVHYVKNWEPEGLNEEQSAKIDDVLNAFTPKNSKHSFWMYYSTFSPTYLLGRAPSGSAEKWGLRMQTSVEQQTSGLLQSMNEMIEHIFEGSFDPQEYSIKLDLYYQCIGRLQTRLDNLKDKITLERSPLTLLSYAGGCDLLLAEARMVHAIAADLSKPCCHTLFKTNAAMQSFLKAATLSPVASTGLLFDASANIVELRREDLSAIQDAQARESVLRIAVTIQHTYDKYAQSYVKLTDAESQAWTTLMLTEPIDSLYAKREDRTQLPAVVQSLVTKLATRTLFLEPKGFVNGDLELVLSVVKRSERYTATMEQSPHFSKIVEAYDTEYMGARKDDLLQEAHQVLLPILQSWQRLRDIYAFAELYQTCLDFQANGMNARRDSLAHTLFSRLNDLAGQHGFPPIYSKFYKKSMEFWGTQYDESAYTLMTELQNASTTELELIPDVSPEERKRVLLESFLVRALITCLQGEEGLEKASAQGHVQNILEGACYQPLRANLCPEVLVLVYENTMNKLLEGKLAVGKNERELFVNDLVQHFMDSQFLPEAYTKVSHALYVLILEEQASPDAGRILTNTFIQKKGKQELKQWMAAYRNFIVSRLANRAIFDQVLPQMNFYGTEDPCSNPQLLQKLNKTLGVKEVEKLLKAAKRNLAYTEGLVKK